MPVVRMRVRRTRHGSLGLMRKTLVLYPPGAMGTAFPGWDLTALKLASDDIVDAGEVGRLAVRVDASPFFTFSGYGVDRDLRGSRFTDDGSYYLTGDLVSLDAEGLLGVSCDCYERIEKRYEELLGPLD